MKTRTKNIIKYVIIAISTLIACTILVVSLFLLGVFSSFSGVDWSANELMTADNNIIILDSNGETLNCDYYNNRPVTHIEELPQHLLNAFVSIEDKKFYTHNGINPKRIVSALLTNISAKRIKQGASTITQQLAKNVYLSNEKTLNRKFKEILLAQDIEKKLSKNEIFEAYLNNIYFGSGTYGIEQASLRYFDKQAKDLSLSQSAVLAGLIKAPSTYSPYFAPEACKKRRDLVLNEMKDDKYISVEEYNSALLEELIVQDNKIIGNNEYITKVIEEACDILSITENQLLKGNYTIQTYMSTDYQNKANSIIDSSSYNIDNTDKGILVISSKTGGIVAYKGSSNNDLLNTYKQPGSTIKPILVYAPAIEYNVITTATPILDEKYSIGNYSPSNFNGKYYGYVTTTEALSQSLNIPAIKILELTGIDRSKHFASKCGITFDKNDKGYSLALGGMTKGLTMLDMTASYIPLSNGGNYIKPSFISSIKKHNDTIYNNKEIKTQVMKNSTSYLITDMLQNCAKSGTAKNLDSLNLAVASKTGTVGTSEGNSSIWNISYTPEIVVCSLISSSSNHNNINCKYTGSNYPTMMTKELLVGSKNISFDKPKNIRSVDIDMLDLTENHRLALASSSTPSRYVTKKYFSQDNMPIAYSDTFDKIDDINISVQVDKVPKITFEAKKYLSYSIYRKNEDIETMIASISNKSDTIEYLDDGVQPDNFYEYYVVASLPNTSKTKTSNIIKVLTKA